MEPLLEQIAQLIDTHTDWNRFNSIEKIVYCYGCGEVVPYVVSDGEGSERHRESEAIDKALREHAASKIIELFGEWLTQVKDEAWDEGFDVGANTDTSNVRQIDRTPGHRA